MSTNAAERGPAESWSAKGLRWTARLTALAAIVLFALVLTAIHRGRLVQASTEEVTATLRTNNGYFDNRVDFSDLDRVRDEVRTLQSVLVELNRSADEDVTLLAATIPDVERLLAAAQGDVRIAERLTGVSAALRDAARDLREITGEADDTIDTIDQRVAAAVDLVDRLNQQLADIDRKLAVLPAAPSPGTTHGQIGVIPR